MCNFLSNFQCNIEKCFCCSCRSQVLHRATQSEQLATIRAEKAWRNSLLARQGRWSIGFTKKSTLGENCVASCWRGVSTLCNGSCKLLRLLRKVELDSTSCNVARNKKRYALQVAEVPCYTAQFFSNLQRNGIALQVAVKIAQCNRVFTPHSFLAGLFAIEKRDAR